MVEIDEKTFERRLNLLFNHFDNNKDTLYNNATLIQVFMGKVNDQDEKSEYYLHSIFLLWLLGYEFTDTIIIFEPKNRNVYFYTSVKKVKILNKLPNKEGKIKIIDKNDKNLQDFLTMITTTNNNQQHLIGTIDGEKHLGGFIKEYLDILKKYKTIDIKIAIESLLSIKEKEEVNLIKQSSRYTSQLFKKVINDMESIIDEGKEITHLDFSKKVEETVNKSAGEMDLNLSFPFIIQSGGNYKLNLDFNNPNIKSDNSLLKFDNIIIMFGLKFKSYCSFISRTFFIDSSREQELNYEILNNLYDFLIKKKIKVGTTLDNIYLSARDFIKKKKPELVNYFIGRIGFGIGLQPKDKFLELNETNHLEIQENMTFVLELGLENVKPESSSSSNGGSGNSNNKKDRPYTMYIADTVVVAAKNDYLGKKNTTNNNANSGNANNAGFVECQVLTNAKLDFDKVSYAIEDEDGDVEEVMALNEESLEDQFGVRKKRSAAIASGLVKGVTPQNNGDGTSLTEEERKNKQLSILQRRKEEWELAQEGKSDGDGGSASTNRKKFSVDEKFANGDIKSYESESALATLHLPDNKIIVDAKRDTVLFPIGGSHVPFHIATIKNASKTDEGDYVHLRINFNNTKQNFGKVYEPAKKYKDNVFIKELSYRGRDIKHLNQVMRDILELRKKISQKERDLNEKQKDVQQGKLKLISKGQKAAKLSDIYMRPGKKQVGVIEAHDNGLRFLSNKGIKIDILYTNIKHAFFQSAQNDIIVLIHFHLYAPIVIGKKTYSDIQFYTEVVEEYDHLVGRFRRQAVSEREAIEEEERERLLKQKLNKEFAAFVKKVEEKSGIEFEIPYRDLEFTGVPSTGRSNVTLVPTVNCLVSLTEYPFFVLTLDEVELAHLERVKFGLRNFDIVFIMKDLSNYFTITSIPIEKIDTIKDWLCNISVLFFEGAASLKWGPILKTIREEENWEPYGPNGWNSFLVMSGEEADDDEDPEQQEDEYVPSSEDENEEEEDDEMYIDDDDDEFEDEEDEEEEEAPSWEELENEAREEDAQKRQRNEDFSDEEDYKKRPSQQPSQKKKKTKK
ncbi:hypothetical protein ABK040_004576 [Willaertia magna]